MKTETPQSEISTPGARVLIVVAPYYRAITDKLVDGASAACTQAGAEVDVVEVPGTFEIPQAIAHCAAAAPSRYEGFIALGCVIRGETSHYDYVCGESARALMDLGVIRGLAIGYGVLTVDSLAQADARSAPARNKGEESARACLALIALKRQLASQ
ncbi:MAG: 6,7-dimethyl-8-ribityllumazine synthase [Alphaproteobacteria bacterium]|nr:6,7-dimethyl-8-ribityllumazine synthase [Alphaproteobacteria bacterium]